MDPLAERIEEPQYDRTWEYGKPVARIVGYDYWTRLTCPLHGTQAEDRGQSSTADFCSECREELDWSPSGRDNWTRTDEEMRQVERAERELVRGGKL
jgi:hypothetical protein